MALAEAIVPFMKECVIAPLDKRLAELERACGIGQTEPPAGTERVAPVVANFVNAKLAPIAHLINELDCSAMRYAGIWSERRTYKRGEMVTHNGGMWFAEEITDGRPGTGGWKLAVKSGQAPGVHNRVGKSEEREP